MLVNRITVRDMGVITKAKGAPRSDSSGGGQKFICNVCSQDITSTVRIRCADPHCVDYDLCVECFSHGLANLHHEPRSHRFQVLEPHSIPIYDDSWGADEELLLLDGAQQYGLGSWADIADHIGGFRTKDEVRDHYIQSYIQSSRFPLPERASPDDTTLSDSIPREQFQANKRRRIDAKKEAIAEAAKSAPVPTKPTSSVPSCHEVSGYMPGRLEFESEYFNEAEEAVQHMQFTPDEGRNPKTQDFDPETDLKMVVMGIYNDRLVQRTDRKRVIFNHKLLEYRKNFANDRKRSRDQRELHHKLKPLARIMSHPNFVTFSEDLEKEQNIRQAIGQLQEWRRMRIPTLALGGEYEDEKGRRFQTSGQLDRASNGIRPNKQVQQPPEVASSVTDYMTKDIPVRLSSSSAANAVPTPPQGTESSTSPKRAPLQPIPNLTPLAMTADAHPDLHILHPEEKDLCSKLHLQPKAYIAIKDAIFRESMKSDGKLKKKHVREISRIDTTKGGRIFEFMVDSGWLSNAART